MVTMVGVVLGLGMLLLLPGNCKLSALGVTMDEVSIKKISKRKIMSVKEDMLNSAFGLCFF
jgi:hypothetical protein